MFADWFIKGVLSKVGSHIPERTFNRLATVLNHLHLGRDGSTYEFRAVGSRIWYEACRLPPNRMRFCVDSSIAPVAWLIHARG
jgi:hypothetical protein